MPFGRLMSICAPESAAGSGAPSGPGQLIQVGVAGHRPSINGVMLLPDAVVGGLAATVIRTFCTRNDDLAFTIELSMIIDNGIFIDDFVCRHWSVNDACAAVGRHHR
jgi:hypothetical protein